MVPNDMVEHPGIRGDPGVKGVGDFEEPVQDRLVEGEEMLVVMVPGADAGLRPDHEHEPGGEHPHAPGLEKYEQVEERERDDAEDRKHVLAVAEYFHGSGLRVGGILESDCTHDRDGREPVPAAPPPHSHSAPPPKLTLPTPPGEHENRRGFPVVIEPSPVFRL